MGPHFRQLNRHVSDMSWHSQLRTELENARFTGDFGNAYHEVGCRYADVVNYAFNEQMLLHIRTLIQSNHSKPN